MPMTRKLYVLTSDVKNTDKRPRKGAARDLPDVFEAGDVFAHEVIVPLRKGKKVYDAYIYIDDNDMPVAAFDRGTKIYDAIHKKLKRAGPSMGRLLHEYNAFMPHTVSEMLQRLIDNEIVSLRQLEDTLLQYRRANDYDMLDENDTVMLPKPGRSRLDADEGRTDPTRSDYDPDLEGYIYPDEEGEDEDGGEDEDENEDEETEPKPAMTQAILDLAERVYEVLTQTPGKTRKLETLKEMTGAVTTDQVYWAMEWLGSQGRIDEKGRVIVK